jgi:hypothetical protein
MSEKVLLIDDDKELFLELIKILEYLGTTLF